MILQWVCKKHHGIKTAILEIIWDSSKTSRLRVRPLVQLSVHMLNQIVQRNWEQTHP